VCVVYVLWVYMIQWHANTHTHTHTHTHLVLQPCVVGVDSFGYKVSIGLLVLGNSQQAAPDE
jgi:hypothetical protein